MVLGGVRKAARVQEWRGKVAVVLEGVRKAAACLDEIRRSGCGFTRNKECLCMLGIG